MPSMSIVIYERVPEVNLRFEKGGHDGKNSKVNDIHDLVNDISDLLVKGSRSKGGAPAPRAPPPPPPPGSTTECFKNLLSENFWCSLRVKNDRENKNMKSFNNRC